MAHRDQLDAGVGDSGAGVVERGIDIDLTCERRILRAGYGRAAHR
ncbi:hypothetical protein [Tsukamurella soli]